MKQMLALTMIASVLLGCKSQKVLPIESNTEKRVETKYEVQYIPDTVILNIPSQKSSVVTSPDTISMLENDFAKSTASVDENGLLHHSLETKPQDKPIPTKKEVVRKDSIVYVDKEVKVPYPVERELTWWEETSIKWFKWLLVLLVAIPFRKKILLFVRRFI